MIRVVMEPAANIALQVVPSVGLMALLIWLAVRSWRELCGSQPSRHR